MNAISEPLALREAARVPLTPAVVRQARAQALARSCSVMQVLQDTLDLPADLTTGLLLHSVGAALHLPVLDMPALDRLAPAFERLSFTQCQRRGVVALHSGDSVLLVLADPFDEPQQAGCAALLGCAHSLALAAAADITAYLARHEDALRAIDSALPTEGSAPVASLHEDLSLRSISEGTSVVVKLVHSTLYDALKSGASDVHFECNASGLNIKYRLDGALAQMGAVEGLVLAEQVLSRLKVMSELDIAERRIPQDGRFRLRAFGRDIDFRVSIMPSIHGEDAVVRVLDKRSLAEQAAGLSLDVLGFDADTLALFRRLTREPYGLLLVTGPTGSGKTTTLYAALSEINHGHDKIITIEDPVEYQLPGVLQIPVNEKKGLSFARGLRSILRHDPDRIMVGEIRDADTAQVAIQAALTGHLVLSSVHANNSFDVIGRFTHMAVDPYSFVSALRGVLAQRLVRINCPKCTAPSQPSAAAWAESGLLTSEWSGMPLQAGRGCGHCRGTGFKGRKAVGELLLLDDGLRELIVARAPLRQIKEAARASGTRFLRDAALDLFRQGQTTLEEVSRVTLVG